MNQDRSQLHELPEPIPDGESVIWRGRPSFKGLALRSFHVREAGIYVGLLLAWRAWSSWSAGMSVAEVVGSTSLIAIVGLGGIGLLVLLAWLFRRASTYTITTKRIILQFGAALPMSMNIPFTKIAKVDLKARRDGTGDIPIKVIDTKRVPYIMLWPHVRPWHMTSPEPMMVSVPDAAQVAAKIAEALAALPAPSADPNVQASNSGPSEDPLGNPPAPVAA